MFKKPYVITTFMLILLVSFLLFTGYWGIWMKGMSYILESPQKYKNIHTSILEEEFSVEVNLLDLESNVGKKIYDDGVCWIYIESIDWREDNNRTEYRVFFRSVGNYSIKGAELVTGIKYDYNEDGSHVMDVGAKMHTVHKETRYNLEVSGYTPLGYRNGDSFGFYIFPSSDHTKGDDFIKTLDTITVTLTGLHKYVWGK